MAKESPLDFFAFHPARFLGSESVTLMELAERGAYITLLCHAWENDGLPSDPRRLARIVGCSVSSMRKMMAGPLGDCWEAREGQRLQNPRLEAERAKATTKVSKAREAAEARWRKDGGEGASAPTGADAQPTPEQCPADADAMPGECGRNADAYADAMLVEKSRVDNTLPSGERESRARGGPLMPDVPLGPSEGTGEPCPQPALAKALAEQLEPVPDASAYALALLGDHVGERTGRAHGVSWWRQRVREAVSEPKKFAERVEWNIHIQSKQFRTPSEEELAEWRGGKPAKKLTSRGAQQARQDSVIQKLVDRERVEGAAVLDVGGPGQRKALQAKVAL